MILLYLLLFVFLFVNIIFSSISIIVVIDTTWIVKLAETYNLLHDRKQLRFTTTNSGSSSHTIIIIQITVI